MLAQVSNRFKYITIYKIEDRVNVYASFSYYFNTINQKSIVFKCNIGTIMNKNKNTRTRNNPSVALLYIFTHFIFIKINYKLLTNIIIISTFKKIKYIYLYR